MENIPLRVYNREIEQLIVNSQSQDALNHCQNILDVYPRCLETYRLKGKAYLELEQNKEAEDTFQIVLSSVPDDFTANLGMSLLREKQNNLDGTIWHMERAYEAQPSNTAVQTELRRLYQQRDGVEISRIRLTRGALVRMYLRGDLLAQATSEIEALLLEDPDRYDIQILQTNVLFKSGATNEALQKCLSLTQKHPYCFEANRLLFENSPKTTPIVEIQKYQQRLRELDPYYEFTTPENPDPLKAPESEVTISIPENLSLKKSNNSQDSGLPIKPFETFGKSNPAFNAESYSGDVDNVKSISSENTEEEKPAWLEGIEIATFQQSNDDIQSESISESSANSKKDVERSGHMTTDEPTPNSEIPEKKDDLSGDSPESSTPANPFLTASGGQIPVAEPGDIPEWLRALASEPPAASSDAITSPLRVPGETGVLQTGEENLDFLRNLPGENIERAESGKDSGSFSVESLPGITPADPFLVTSETTQPIPLEGETEAPQPPTDMPDWMRTDTDKKPSSPLNANFPSDESLESPFEQIEETPHQVGSPESHVTETQAETGKSSQEMEDLLEQLRKDTAPGVKPPWLQEDNLGNELEALFEKGKEDSAGSTSKPATNWADDLRDDVVNQAENQSTSRPTNVPEWLFSDENDEEDTAPIQLEPPVTDQPTPGWLNPDRSDEFSDKDRSSSSDSNDILANRRFDASKVNSDSDVNESTSDQAFDFFNDNESKDNPPDLASLLREDADKEIHTFPLEEESPVEQSFVPSDIFNAADFEQDETIEEKSTEITGANETREPIDVKEVPPAEKTTPIEEPSPEPEIKLEQTIDEPELPVEQTPAIPVEDLKPLEFVGPLIPVDEEEPVATNEIAPEEEPVPAWMPSDTETGKDQSSSIQDEIDKLAEEVAKAQKLETEEIPSVPTTAAETTTVEPIQEVISAIPVEDENEPAGSLQQEEELNEQTEEQIVDQPVTPVVESKAKSKPLTSKSPQPAQEKEVIKTKPAIEVKTPEPEPEPVFETEIIKPVPVSKPAPASPTKARPSKPKEARRTTRRAAKPRVTSEKPAASRGPGAGELNRARESISKGDLIAGLRRYIKLVNASKSLDIVSNDLKDIVKKNPKDYLAWQTYGDARLRSNRIQDALDAYAKAAELLK